MLEQLSGKAINRPSDGKPVENVVFLQCAGQRDPKHLSYCSAFCCVTALKQAIEEENGRPHPDEIRVGELKREKLKIKDEIFALESKH